MLAPLPDIEADGLSQLVCALALDGWPNDQICIAARITPQKVESTIRAIRATGVVLDRPSVRTETLLRLCWIGHIVSGNLRKQVAHYEALEHPQPTVVAARRVGKDIGRSAEWVNAVALWYRKGVASARAELGGKVDETIEERGVSEHA